MSAAAPCTSVPTQATAVPGPVQAEDGLAEALLAAKDAGDEEVTDLTRRLKARCVPELKTLAKRLHVRLTGSKRKADIIERLINMAKMGLVRLDEDDDGDVPALTYVTDEVKELLRSLPKFDAVDLWSKTVRGVLTDFTFMNLLVYLVYGRDKTFDMKAMKAFKSLKGYKFFADKFVKNVWLHDCKTESPRIVYARGFVYHSLTMDDPLEVFLSVDGDSGDVFSAQCNCVSG